MIEAATSDDIADLGLLGLSFFEESPFAAKGMTLSPTRIVSSLAAMIDSPDCVVHVVRQDGKVVGGALWALDSSWTEEPIAIEVLFYMHPQYRRRALSKALLQAGIDACYNAGARLMYSTSTAGFDDNGANARAYNMLFQSCGFSIMPNSCFLIREL